MQPCVRTVSRLLSKDLKTQIQKGANREKTARHGYEKTCDYLEILEKRIIMQQRAFACQSKVFAHLLQRELYTMGNSILLRREAEMTHLQPHLEQTRRQELRNSPFWLLLCSCLSLLRREKSSSLKKAPRKTLRVLDPITISPFAAPTTTKEAPTGNAPVEDIPLQAVTNHFP